MLGLRLWLVQVLVLKDLTVKREQQLTVVKCPKGYCLVRRKWQRRIWR